jgi:hypothetical protein
MASGLPNVTLVRVWSVPRMPGVDDRLPRVPAPGTPPAAETRATEAARSLPAAESRLVDAPVELDTSDIRPRNRR